MTEKDAQFELNGAKYKLAIVLQNARSSPELYVKPNLHVKLDDDVADSAANKIVYTSAFLDSADVSETIVLVKQHGVYTLLAGYNKVSAALAEGKGFKARFMSSVALKKAKVHVEDLSQPSLTTNPVNDVSRHSSTRPEYANQRDPDNGYSRYGYARGQRPTR